MKRRKLIRILNDFIRFFPVTLSWLKYYILCLTIILIMGEIKKDTVVCKIGFMQDCVRIST
jgi:hypothetical protein